MTEGHERTVLVVDDANGLVDIYERWLEDEFRVLTATDGQTAISTVDETVDVVLIDRDLPKMSGSTVVEEIRNLGHDPAIVLLSSVEPDYDAVDVDFRTCLTKPVMRRDLVGAVGNADGEGRRDDPDRSGPTIDDHARMDATRSTDGDRRADDSDPSEEESSGEDITERLQSLQSDLQSTADELAERASGRSGADDDRDVADEDAESDATDDGEGETQDGDPPSDPPDVDDAGKDGDADSPRDVLPDPDDAADDEEGEDLQTRVERLASKATELAEGAGEDGESDA